MSAQYQVMYRIGFTPWERDERPEPLVQLVHTLPCGSMLDLGCGTGGDAVWCAQQGWSVTGVDNVSVAIDRARKAAASAAVEARFLHADITKITAAELGSGFTLLQDIGCFAQLDDAGRRRAAATITEVAAPGARLLMFAFGEGGGRGPMQPRRLELPTVRALFTDWDVEFSRPAIEIDMKGPMRDAPRAWHQLVKR
jgi:SAM-dependent methyltransferase